jgi:hypothetical protein
VTVGMRSRLLASLGVVVLALAACTAIGSSNMAFHPSLTWGQCPIDVEIQFISRHQCGWLTVLEDRSKPEGRTLQLFVVKTWPVGITPPPFAGSGFGTDLSEQETYTQKATGATRIGRIGYTLERRGTGHSVPSLACPEAEQIDGRDADAVRTLFLGAVAACHDRLVAEGVDLSAYDVQAVAQDLEDLRVALGLQEWWNLGSYGSSSRFLFEYLREFPNSVRSAYLDSPQFPQLDEVTGSIEGTRYALHEVFAACRAATACVKASPTLRRPGPQLFAALRPTRSTVRSPAILAGFGCASMPRRCCGRCASRSAATARTTWRVCRR